MTNGNLISKAEAQLKILEYLRIKSANWLPHMQTVHVVANSVAKEYPGDASRRIIFDTCTDMIKCGVIKRKRLQPDSGHFIRLNEAIANPPVVIPL